MSLLIVQSIFHIAVVMIILNTEIIMPFILTYFLFVPRIFTGGACGCSSYPEIPHGL